MNHIYLPITRFTRPGWARRLSRTASPTAVWELVKATALTGMCVALGFVLLVLAGGR
jgi:hypothetical protein